MARPAGRGCKVVAPALHLDPLRAVQVQGACTAASFFSVPLHPMRYASPHTTGSLEAALELYRKSLRLVPLAGKRALVKDWPNLHLREHDIRFWSLKGVNWGILTGEPLVVFDTDSAEAETWVQDQGIDSPVVVRSGGGGRHRYFRCPAETEVHSRSAIHGIGGLDLKGWRSYIVAVGSIHPETRRRYEYLPGKALGDLDALPVFDPLWVQGIQAEPLPKPRSLHDGKASRGRIGDIRTYIRSIPSVQGQGGDKACFTVACLLVEAGFTFDEALAELEAWNEVCALPHWSRAALIHKVRYAFQRVTGQG